MSSQNQKKPRILIIGATGRIGSRVIVEIAKVDSVQAVYSSRTLEQVNAWRKARLGTQVNGLISVILC